MIESQVFATDSRVERGLLSVMVEDDTIDRELSVIDFSFLKREPSMNRQFNKPKR
ncbi:MAG: hypothetical protein VKL39_01290 [Leptolyngbyaceae bacterium]|nr:hypothetical protein [Leptolyngbyaceae bacterium]